MHRFSMLAAAAVALLTVAGLASATPRLIVTGTTIQVLEEKSDAAPLKITIFVPSGYTATLAQTAGSQIGTVHADLQALQISPDAIIQADGTVLAADPARPARAVFGAKIINAKMTLNPTVIGAPTSGSYLWRSIITPWNTAAPAPDALHTVETQSFVALPQAATLKAKVKKSGKKRTVTLSGAVTEGGSGVSGASVALYAGSKKVATVTTSSSGKYSKTLPLKKKTKFQAKVTVPQRDATCQSPLPATSVPGGCASATIAGYTKSSAVVSAKP